MSLEELRSKLTAVDEQIVELIAERQRIVGDIGRSKRSSGAGTRDYAREKDVIDMGRARAESLGLDPEVAERILDFERSETGLDGMIPVFSQKPASAHVRVTDRFELFQLVTFRYFVEIRKVQMKIIHQCTGSEALCGFRESLALVQDVGLVLRVFPRDPVLTSLAAATVAYELVNLFARGPELPRLAKTVGA